MLRTDFIFLILYPEAAFLFCKMEGIVDSDLINMHYFLMEDDGPDDIKIYLQTQFPIIPKMSHHKVMTHPCNYILLDQLSNADGAGGLPMEDSTLVTRKKETTPQKQPNTIGRIPVFPPHICHIITATDPMRIDTIPAFFVAFGTTIPRA